MGKRTGIVLLLAASTGLLGWAWLRQREVERGAAAFHQYGCLHCHGSSGAPHLAGVTSKYDDETLRRFIHDPESVYTARRHKPLNAGYMPMPRLNVTPSEAKAIVAYLKQQSD
jgi:mono/diheme cytochrome c family protein